MLVAFGFFNVSSAALQSAAQLGDMFGGINALFTALAFVMVWWSGDMQRRELSLQRRDLSLQLDELKAQRDELSETRAVFKRQNFEASFFQQLSVVMALAGNIHAMNEIGSEAFKKLASLCSRIAAGEAAGDRSIDSDLEYKNYICDVFVDRVYIRYEGGIGSYFRTLYHIFKLIDAQDFSEIEKVSYTNIVRAQLSADVLMVLSCNALTTYGEGFVDLIEKYGVFKHLKSDASIARIRKLYRPTAFMGLEQRTVYFAAEVAA